MKFDDDLALNEAMFEKYPTLENIYQNTKNPNFVVFYLENVSIKIQDFGGREEILKY